MFGRKSSRRDNGRHAEGGTPRRGPSAGQTDEAGPEEGWDDMDGLHEPAAEQPTSPRAPGGPYDSAEVGDPAAGNRLDLGALWMPGVPGMELRLEIDEPTGVVLSAVCVLGQSAMQVRVLAAPRSGGLWQEMRRDHAEELRGQGGDAQESTGPFGDELRAEVPTQAPDGRVVRQQARFVGVEGPRWLLHVVFTGDAAHDAYAAAQLEDLLRDVVVVRGSDPMVRGELLELRLPPQTPPEPRSGAEPVGSDTGLNPFERGPEITEIR